MCSEYASIINVSIKREKSKIPHINLSQSEVMRVKGRYVGHQARG